MSGEGEVDRYIEPPPGWSTFGTHVDTPGPLEFSKECDEAGMPRWERLRPRPRPACCGGQGMSDVIAPARAHMCMTNDFPDDVQALGTLATCGRCGQWYRLIAHYPEPAGRVWKRVGRWDFRDRRRIRKHAACACGGPATGPYTRCCRETPTHHNQKEGT